MAHFNSPTLERPSHFNFARDVVDFWAAKTPPLQAMLWTSQDTSQTRNLTYAHFQRESHRVSVLLESLGVKPGQAILMILPRIPEWWEITIAALRSGIIFCPATTLLVSKDIEFRCQQTHATVFIGDASSVQKFQQVRSHCPEIRTVIQVDDGPCEDSTVTDFRKAMKGVPKDVVFETRTTRAEDPALIFFTSGTTGNPKMVLHNHTSYPLAHTVTGKHWLQLSPGKLYWNLSEQGWAKAAWSFFGAWNCGAALFIHDDRQPFNPIRLLSILHTFPITTLCAPPTAYRQLVLDESKNYLASLPPHSLEHCTGAGEPLNDSVIKVWASITGLEIYDGYGQTETIMMCGNFAGSGAKIKPGSMGKPSPGVPLAVVNAAGGECKAGQEGDIGVLIETEGGAKSTFFGIFDGYLDSNGTVDRRIKTLGKKRWYLTGDRATRDDDGYFWFVGRADDVINSSGYRIGPFEVESTLKSHPGVIESAVISSPHSSRGEVVKAFIVLTPSYTERAQQDSARAALISEIQEFCKRNAAPYKYPRKIEFVDAAQLPKTISGKIKRAELKAREWSGGNGTTTVGAGAGGSKL